jgi:hypothetical protein
MVILINVHGGTIKQVVTLRLVLISTDLDKDVRQLHAFGINKHVRQRIMQVSGVWLLPFLNAVSASGTSLISSSLATFDSISLRYASATCSIEVPIV